MATNERSSIVHVKPQFQRSVRLDADFSRSDALAGYICQPSPRHALGTIAKHVNETSQRAFTWTGPYGGGKSSLALALAQLTGGNTQARKAAKKALEIEADDDIHRAFGSRKPWLVLPVVGRREAVEIVIGEMIDKMAPAPGRKPEKHGRRNVTAELVKRADSGEYPGVLLILDELGKLLEAAAAAGDDIYFYQELAEAASRAEGRLVVVGVLHQSFDQYVVRSGREIQAEWAKVQGRFVDVPIVAGTDEVIQLIGGALSCEQPHANSLAIAETIANGIHRRRPSSPPTLSGSLDRCWPLHPVTAALLGPSSRRKFGQNERSIFSFLTSADPLGFRDFLQGYSGGGQVPYYTPARYWDYLQSNFEPAILSSPDGHRWAISADAVARVEARFREPHVSLVKTTSLIELFRNGSGLAAEDEILASSLEGFSHDEVISALDDLAKASVLVYRKHLQAWGVYAGSDFDIEAAVAEARQVTDPSTEDQLRTLSTLPPLSARRHYSETGTLRWFDRQVTLAESAKIAMTALNKKTGSSAGRFVLLLPSAGYSLDRVRKIAKLLSQEPSEAVVLYGAPKETMDLAEQASELSALTHVASTHRSLDSDAVARKEIDARLQHLQGEIESSMRDAFSHAQWFFRGEKSDVKPNEGLSPLASAICDQVFRKAPRVHSELVNRDALSSNSAKARRVLMHRMIAYGDRPELDYVGYPADAGLYYTILAELGLHQSRDGQGIFVAPDQLSKHPGADSLRPFWASIQERLQSAQGPVTLSEIYERATKAPYGIKNGLLPILALAFLLTHRSEIALYVDGMFTPELNDAGVDEWLQDPTRISWSWVHMDADTKQLLAQLSARLEQVTQREVAADPLDSARALVSLALSLPTWTQRTLRLSDVARKVRTALLRASDPIKVIFVDLPELLGVERKPDALVSAVGAVVDELYAAYPLALQRISRRLMETIDHTGSYESLQARAKVVQGISGDFKLDAFASRLQSLSDDSAGIEGLVSLATSKPPGDFNDHDLDHATMQLAKWAFEFRRIEALATVQDRSASRRALAVVFGAGDTVSGSFDVAEEDGEVIRQLADGMLRRVTADGIRPGIFLAALVEAGVRALELQREEAL